MGGAASQGGGEGGSEPADLPPRARGGDSRARGQARRATGRRRGRQSMHGRAALASATRDRHVRPDQLHAQRQRRRHRGRASPHTRHTRLVSAASAVRLHLGRASAFLSSRVSSARARSTARGDTQKRSARSSREPLHACDHTIETKRRRATSALFLDPRDKVKWITGCAHTHLDRRDPRPRAPDRKCQSPPAVTLSRWSHHARSF